MTPADLSFALGRSETMAENVFVLHGSVSAACAKSLARAVQAMLPVIRTADLVASGEVGVESLRKVLEECGRGLP